MTRLMCAASAVVSVVMMAGCATIAAKFRRTAPVTTNPVVVAQSNGDGAYEFDGPSANPDGPGGEQYPQGDAMHQGAIDQDDQAENTISPRATDIMSSVAHNDDPSVVPDVNMYGEFDGIERSLNQPSIGAVGFQQQTFGYEGFDCDVTIDPTGKWMAFSSTRHSKTTDIYVQATGGTSVTQVTNDSADDAAPCFSPDGKSIAFASTRAGSWDLYVMDVDGRNVVQITNGPSQDLHPSFSPDGTRLVYCSAGNRSGQWELWVADLRTKQKRMVGYGLFPSWSPDKSVDRIAFQRARHRGSRWFTLWTLDLVDGEATRVTEVAASTNAAIVSPTWAPDGKRLAFATIVEPAKMSGGRPAGQQDVWTINADGTDRQRLTDGQGTNLQPYWGRDNRVYFISDRGGIEAVWSVMAPTGGALMAKTAEPSPKREAAASTDTRDLSN
jgi:Tol biopolymer transport system component